MNLFTYGAQDVGPVTGVEIHRDDSKSYGVDPDWAFDSVRTLRFTMIMIMIINLNDCRSGNCNLSICKLTRKKCRNFNGIQTCGICVSAAMFYQLSYEDPDMGSRPIC